MKGLNIANKLASAVDSYHAKSKPHGEPKVGPSGPDHKVMGVSSSPAEESENNDIEHTYHTDTDKLKEVLCPGCNDRLRSHLASMNADGDRGAE